MKCFSRALLFTFASMSIIASSQIVTAADRALELAAMNVEKPKISPWRAVVPVKQCGDGQFQCRVGVSSWCCSNGQSCNYDEGGCE